MSVQPVSPIRLPGGQARALRPCLRAAAAAALALLAACGGGGSGDAGIPVVPSAATITANNYEGVARQAVNAADYMGDATGLVTGAQVAPGAQALFAFSRGQALRLGQLFARSPQLLTGVTTTDTLGCSGGGNITVRATDVNGNEAVDAGDSGVLTANNCVEGGATISGTLSISFSAVSGNLDSDVYSATVSITMQGLAASGAGGSATGNGSFTIAIASNSATSGSIDMLVPSLVLTGNLGGVNDTITLQDYHLVTSTALSGGRLRTSTTVSGGMSSNSVAGGLVTLSTVQPLVEFETDAYPSSGQLLASGANGTRMRLTVQSTTSVLLELDADGNGSYETNAIRTWDALI